MSILKWFLGIVLMIIIGVIEWPLILNAINFIFGHDKGDPDGR